MLNRWVVYLKERFPLVRTGVLVAVFCLAILSFTGLAEAGTDYLPAIGRVGAAFLSTLILFFQLRVADEFKDAEIDARYRPERPVPRGLVTLHELALAAGAGAIVQLAIALSLDVGLVPVLAAVWLYMGLMTVEFLVPAWLRSRPVVYLVSHMLVMPMIAFYVSAFGWLVDGSDRPDGLGWVLALSFFVGLVLEIGRKIRPPCDERKGVETYSALWGADRAVSVWVLSVLGASTAFLMALCQRAPDALAWLPGLAPPLLCLALLTIRRGRPTPALYRGVEPASALVAICLYAGLVPLQQVLGG